MRLNLNIFAGLMLLLFWVGTGCALCHGLSEPETRSASDNHANNTADGAKHTVNTSDCTMMAGSNGGRGGLPPVKLRLKTSQIDSTQKGAREITQAVKRLGADKEEMIQDLEILTEHADLAVPLLVAQLHPIPSTVYYPSKKTKESRHVICCLRALRYLTGVSFTAKTNSKLTDDQRQFLDFNKQMHDDNPEHNIHFFGVWMSRDADFVAPVDAQRRIIDQWKQWQIMDGSTFRYTPSKKPADSMDDWYWYS